MIGLIFMMFGLMIKLMIWAVRLTVLGTVALIKLMVLMFAACAALMGASSRRLRQGG